MPRRTRTTGNSQSDVNKPIRQLPARVQFPPTHNADIQLSNHLGVVYQDGFFVLMLGRALAPLEMTRLELTQLARRGVEATVVGEFAIPADKFIEAIDRFQVLIQRLRDQGVLDNSAGGSSETSGND